MPLTLLQYLEVQNEDGRVIHIVTTALSSPTKRKGKDKKKGERETEMCESILKSGAQSLEDVDVLHAMRVRKTFKKYANVRGKEESK